MNITELDLTYFDRIKELFRDVFSAPPWNEDWSNDEQLTDYLKDLMDVRNPIIYGLFEGDILIGFSIGRIKHWYAGVEYFIEELCIKRDFQGKGYGRKFFSLMEVKLKERGIGTIFLMTDRNQPAYEFYRRIGFTELTELTSFMKNF